MGNVDKMVKVFVKMRDAKAEMAARHKLEEATIEEQMDVLKHAIEEEIKATGGTAIKTEFGTATRVVKRRFWTADKDAFLQFCIENKVEGMLDVRVAQKNTGEWIDAHPDQIPNGINVEQKYDVVVRRATN